MNNKTPFLTGFPTLLCGRAKRQTQALLASRRDQFCRGASLDIQQQLRDEIDPALLELHSTTQRVRGYPDVLTFWSFLAQTLDEDASCSRAVSRVQVWARDRQLPVPSAGTSSYCAARAGLPIAMLQAVNASLFAQLEANLPSASLWRGHRVRAEDATSAQMPDTEKNRAAYPYPSGQAPGCGFPMIALGAFIDLGHGGLQDFSASNINTGEQRGHDLLEEYLKSGDILVADRLYSSYEVMARLHQRGVHFIGRPHQSRKMDFRRGRKLGRDERVQTCRKPRWQPKASQLDKDQWEALPEQLELRIIRSYGPDRQGNRQTRYVVTTLLDPCRYPAQEVSSLYLHRWEIELRFRDIKTTMGMEMLRTKSPEMIHREVLMNMIVYNLIRLLILKAANAHGISPRRISFKGALQVLGECRVEFKALANRPGIRGERVANLWSRIAERLLDDRPGRNEPRRVKRRPKCTRWMQKPRRSYVEHFRCDSPPTKTPDACP